MAHTVFVHSLIENHHHHHHRLYEVLAVLRLERNCETLERHPGGCTPYCERYAGASFRQRSLTRDATVRAVSEHPPASL